MIDARLLEHCTTDTEKQIIQQLIPGKTQKEAAEWVGVSKRHVEKTLAKIRARAAEKGDALLSLTKQTIVRRDAEGRIAGWDKSDNKAQKTANMVQSMIDGMDRKPFKANKFKPNGRNDICGVLPVADPHFGMLAWGRESGSDYNVGIAKEILLNGVAKVIHESPKCDRVYFVNLGDYYHFDGQKAVTPNSGNILDADSRYGKVIETANDCYFEIIDMLLQKYKHITLYNVCGNHDESSGLWLNQMAKREFRKEKRVTTTDNMSAMQHFSWEKNLVAMHHGHGVNHQKIRNAIVRDLRAEHGRASYTLALNGHLHGETVNNEAGIRSETISTIAPQDSWHSSNLYGSPREMSMINLKKSGGISSRFYFDPVRDLPRGEVS